jgi:hypothetical protein
VKTALTQSVMSCDGIGAGVHQQRFPSGAHQGEYSTQYAVVSSTRLRELLLCVCENDCSACCWRRVYISTRPQMQWVSWSDRMLSHCAALMHCVLVTCTPTDSGQCAVLWFELVPRLTSSSRHKRQSSSIQSYNKGDHFPRNRCY